MYNKDNIFAKIIRKEIDAKIIFEDDCVVAFHDIAPSAPVHIIIIPKEEFVNYSDFVSNASGELLQSFFSAIPKVAEVLDVKDYRLVANNGVEAGQTIFHFHVHLLSGTKMSEVL